MSNSEKLKEFYKTEKGLELKRKLAELVKGKRVHLGYKNTPESIEKMRVAKLGKKASPETRLKMSQSHKHVGRFFSKAHRKHISEGLKRLYQTPHGKELRKNIDNINKGNHHHLGHRNTPESLAHMSKVKMGHIHSHETRQKMSKSQKALWASSPEHREKLVKAVSKSLHSFPNKPETAVLNLLKGIAPNDWKYTGNGDVMIHGKNPDFWNCNGKKSCILLHGIYWHLWKPQEKNPELTKETVEQKDKDFYKKYGYDTLIIWEDELSNLDNVKQKIIEFTQKELVGGQNHRG